MNQRDQGAVARRQQGGLSRHPGMNPWRELDEMSHRMEDMFNYFFGYNFPRVNQEGSQLINWQEPEVDIYENNNEYIIHAALPGIAPNDIKIQATEESIELSAESHSPFETSMQGTQGAETTGQGQANVSATGQGQQGAMSTSGTELQQSHTQLRQGRYSSQRQFRFYYTLPTEIDPKKVRANFRHGMLELHLPKQQPAQVQTVQVPISADASTQTGGAWSGQQDTSQYAKTGQSYTPTQSGGQTHTRGGDVSSTSSQTPNQTPASTNPKP